MAPKIGGSTAHQASLAQLNSTVAVTAEGGCRGFGRCRQAFTRLADGSFHKHRARYCCAQGTSAPRKGGRVRTRLHEHGRATPDRLNVSSRQGVGDRWVQRVTNSLPAGAMCLRLTVRSTSLHGVPKAKRLSLPAFHFPQTKSPLATVSTAHGNSLPAPRPPPAVADNPTTGYAAATRMPKSCSSTGTCTTSLASG